LLASAYLTSTSLLYHIILTCTIEIRDVELASPAGVHALL